MSETYNNYEGSPKEDLTDLQWIEIGQKDERNHNHWQADSSYIMAGEEGKPHREALIKKEARRSPTRAYLMLRENDDKKLYKIVEEEATKKKLELLREHIQKNFL